MSNSGILARISASVTAVIRTPLWVSVVAAEGVFALVATSLTVLSRETNTEGLDSGRMALSFTTMLVLAFALFTVPAIVDRVRHATGASGFLDSFVTAFVVGWSLVFAATPALAWAILATGVGPDVWIPALGALKLEVLIVDVLVAVAFAAVRKAGTATALAYAAITSLVVGPFLVLGTVAALPGVQQTTEYWTFDWGKEGEVKTDPVTGYPIDPTCPSPTTSTTTVPRYNTVWAAAPIIPFVLVSEAVEPKMAYFVNTMWMGETEAVTPESPKTTAPIDLFTTFVLPTRQMQLSPTERIVINECTLLEETGNPYAPYPYGPSSETIIAGTQSGFVPGLIGQGVIVGAWVIGLLVIPRLRRQK